METQLKNSLSIVEVKKMAWYLVRIFGCYGAIAVCMALLGLDMTQYPQWLQMTATGLLNWLLEWFNQYKKEVRL